MFTKKDLKTGMLVKLRDGMKYLIVNGYLIGYLSHFKIDSYNDDLTFRGKLYYNGTGQTKDFIEGAVTTYTNELEHIMNKCISMFFPKLFTTYWIKCDSMQVQKKEEEFESQRKDVMNVIRTINEIRIERGLEPVTDENADKLLMNKNVSLLEDISLDPSLNIEE